MTSSINLDIFDCVIFLVIVAVAKHLHFADGYDIQQRFEERIAFSAPTPSAPAFNSHVEGQAAPVAAAMQVTNLSSAKRSLEKSLLFDASFGHATSLRCIRAL